MTGAKMKSVVLLSGGLDSTVNFYRAIKEGEVKLAITFNYGQRAASQEIAAAKKMTQAFSVPHKVIELPYIKEFGQSSLTDSSQTIPAGHDVKIDDLRQSRQTAKSVWVPNRNGIFLNIAAGFAESLKAEYVVPGFNAEEAATFPDNSKDFIDSLNKTFQYSTSNHVTVKCWTTTMSKTDIIREGLSLGVRWNDMWPCYLAESKWCGQCESCQRAKRAFTASGVDCAGLFLK